MSEPPKHASRFLKVRRSASTSSIGRSWFPPGKLQSNVNLGRPSLPKEVALTGPTSKKASVGCEVKPASLVGDSAAITKELPAKPAFVVGGFEDVQTRKTLTVDMPPSPTGIGTEKVPVKPASAVGSFGEVWPAEPLAGDATAVGTKELQDEEFLEDVADEEVVPLVTVGFYDRVSKAKAPFVSAPNIEKFSMITKVELLSHFLPPSWEGVIKLKPAKGCHDTVALFPFINPDGNGLMWSLGVGDYIMEAIPKKPLPTLRGSSGGRGSVSATPAAKTGLGGQGTRSFHSAASTFGSASAARFGGQLPFSGLSSGVRNRSKPAYSGPAGRPSTSSLNLGGTMMGGRPPLSAPSSGVTSRLNSRGVVGGRGGAQVRPAASSLSMSGTLEERGGVRTAAKGNVEKGKQKSGVEDIQPWRKLERVGGLGGLSPKTMENLTVSTRIPFEWGKSWMEGKRGGEEKGSEVSSGVTKKGNKEGGEGEDEWAKGMFGKGRDAEREGRGEGKEVTKNKEMDDWAKGLFGKDGELGRIRKEIAKEDVLSMKEA
jgi:hypothetical protein